MTENKQTYFTKQPLNESMSGLNKINPMVQDRKENISRTTSRHIQNSVSGIGSCSPNSMTSEPTSTASAQTGSIGACTPKTGNGK